MSSIGAMSSPVLRRLRRYAHPITDPLVQQRKALVARLEKLWPAVEADRVLETVFDRVTTSDAASRDVPGMPTRRNRDTYLRTIRPTILDPRYGILFDGARIVWGSSDFPDRERDIDFLSVLRPAETIDEAIIGSGHYSGSYYHFFDDFLVKFIAADAWGVPADVPMLVPFNIYETPFFKAAEQLGVFGGRKILRQPRKRSVRLRKAHIVRPPMIHHAYFDAIATRFVDEEPPSPKRRLLIDRSAHFGRRILNRDQLKPLIDRFALEVVVMEELSLKDQANLFRSAELVVAAHGASLVNMLFSKSPCSIVEITPTAFPGTDAYVAMAAQRGFPFKRIRARSQIGKGARSGFTVDPALLEEAIATVDAARVEQGGNGS